MVLIALILSTGSVLAQGGGNPDKPSNLQVSGVTSTTATLSWGAVTGVDHYQVEVTVGNNTVFSDTTSATSIEATGLAAGTSHKWHVRSVAADGRDSPWANGPDFTTLAGPPAPPSNLRETNMTATGATLGWDAATGATSYDYEVVGTDKNGSTSNTSVSITGLSGGTTYTWRVRSKNTSSGLTSDWASSSFTTLVPLPSAPTGLTSTPSTDGASLAWAGVPGATSYEIEVDTRSNMNSPIWTGTSATASVSVTGLQSGTQYYWRVAARNTAGLGAYSSVANFTTTSAPPPTPTGLAATSITSTGATLSWNSVAGATSYDYEVVGTDKSGNTSNTTVDISGLSGGTTYTWRVRSKNSSTNLTSEWASSTFATTAPAPQAPTLLSPANGATGISTSAPLSWNASTGATSYHVQLADDSRFRSNDIKFEESSVSGTSTTASGLEGGTTYFWRVSAIGQGGEGSFSSAWTFTTARPPPPAPTDLAATPTATGAALSWSASAGASSYDVVVSANSDFSTSAWSKNQTTSTSESATGLLSGTMYYWRVRARNSSGSGDWSSSSFTTLVPPPSVPTLSSPANSATGVSISPTLSWGTTPSADSYHVQVADDSRFRSNDIKFEDSNVVGLSVQVSGLSPSTTYYWRVSAKNSGGESAYSSSWSFRTLSPPSKPTNLNPIDGLTGVSTSPILSWGSVAGATSYSIVVSERSNYSNPTVNESALPNPSTAITGLKSETKYYWKVSAINEAGSSEPAEATFTTTSTRPTPPGLVAPDNGATGLTLPVTLYWSSRSGQTYDVEISEDGQFNSNKIVESATGLRTGTYQTTLLGPDKTYYWHVRTITSDGTSDWSTARNFRTARAELSAPRLQFPSDGATGVSIPPNLIWEGSGDSVTYSVQISTERGNRFTTAIVFDTTGVRGTSLEPEGLTTGATYYWRVQARDTSNVTSNWSEEWKFTTATSLLAAPLLLSPSNAAEGVSTSPTFEWLPVDSAVSYLLQYSTDRNFRRDTVDIGGITTTSKRVSGLMPEKKYYWRVKVIGRVGTSEWSEEWEFTTGTGRLATPLLQFPSDGATGVSIPPNLIWEGSGDSVTYSVQISTERGNRFTTAIVFDTTGVRGTSLEPEGLTTGATYYWRVQARDTSNVTSNWSEEWKFTTATSLLAAPLLLSPSNAAEGVSTSPTFEWLPVDSAVSYLLQYSTDRNFRRDTVDIGGITTTSKRVSGLMPEKKYYWRVKVIGRVGTSEWSEEWEFTTGTGRLATPLLQFPMDESTGVSTAPTLMWVGSGDSVTYNVQVSKERGNRFTTAIVFDTTGVEGTSVSVHGLLLRETYYWRVQAKDSSGTSAWSPEWKFTTGSGILAAPLLLAPPDNKEGESLTPLLVWASVDGATTYSVQYSNDRRFERDVSEIGGVTRTSVTLGELQRETRYYWRVRGSNGTDSSDWSTDFSFKTGSGMLSAPVLVSPPDRSEVPLSTNPTLVWETVQGATAYDVQVSTKSSFSDPVVNETGLTPTSLTVANLEPNKWYYWRVRATNTVEKSSWSEARFSTGVTRLFAPQLVSPSDGASAVSRNPSLSWNAVDGATSYTVQVADDARFRGGDIKFERANVSGTTIDVSGLSANTQYFWRVMAAGPTGESDFSDIWNFTTAATTLAAPMIDSPPNGATNVSTNPSLSWRSVDGATSYDVQVSEHQNFSLLILDQNVQATSVGVTGLSAGKRYYWQVRARNASEASGWSVASFTTLSQSLARPTLVAPADRATGIALTPTLSWNAVSGAATYAVQLSEQQNFSNLIVNVTNVSITTYGISSGLTGGKRYYWRVSAASASGASDWSDVWSFTTLGTTSVERVDVALPREYRLSQNYPNPFNPSTTIEFDVATAGHVSIAVYDPLGHLVSLLVDQHLAAGSYRTNWNAGRSASGVYFYRIHAGNFSQTRRLTLIK